MRGFFAHLTFFFRGKASDGHTIPSDSRVGDTRDIADEGNCVVFLHRDVLAGEVINDLSRNCKYRNKEMHSDWKNSAQ